MPLPQPSEYQDWRDWASAMMVALGLGDTGIVAGSSESVGASYVPAPYVPLWVNTDLELLYGGNVYGSTPTAPDIVFIDTAMIADAAIETQNVADLAISTAKIGNAAIVSAKIGDLQVITAKIADLAVNNAKIANLAVGSANIIDAAINNAKIGNLAVGVANIIDLSVTGAKIDLATITAANIGLAQISTALIQNAAIVNALIGAAAVGTANIIDASISTAKIIDAAITSAKIISLVIDKVTAGTLDAEIDMGTGLIRFTIAGNQLTIGKGFGTAGQFIMWFGPAQPEATMDEGAAVFYLKTDGSAYFGGALLAGVLRTTGQTSDQSATAEIVIGDFSSNGDAISAQLSYQWRTTYTCNAGTGSITGPAGAATIELEGSTDSGGIFTSLATVNATETFRDVAVDGDPGVDDVVTEVISGGTTVSWTPGAQTDLQLRGRLTSRTLPDFHGTSPSPAITTQFIAVSSTENP